MVMNIPRMRHHALITFTLFLTILGGTGCPMERGFIFFPDRTIFETPADIGLVFEDLYLLTSDAVASYDYLQTRSDLDPAKIIVFGQSLGAGVAVELAVQRRVYGLILEAP